MKTSYCSFNMYPCSSDWYSSYKIRNSSPVIEPSAKEITSEFRTWLHRRLFYCPILNWKFSRFLTVIPQAARTRIQPSLPTVVNYLKFPNIFTVSYLYPQFKVWFISYITIHFNLCCALVLWNYSGAVAGPHTHRLWSTSFRLVVTWLTYVRVYGLYGWGRGDYQKEGRGVSGVSCQVHIFYIGHSQYGQLTAVKTG